MAVAITVGDLRNKSKVRTALDDGDLYEGETPILRGGIERTFIHVGIVIPDSMTQAQVDALLAGGFSVRFNSA